MLAPDRIYYERLLMWKNHENVLKYRCRLYFNFLKVFNDGFNKHSYNFDDLSKNSYSKP